jgi:adenosylcobinamide-GDP ribazoletransferase
MIVREVRYFLVAVQFLTRIPVRTAPGFEPEWLDHSAKYFPLVGALVGCISAAVFWAAAAVWPPAVPAILAVAAGIAVTGAFHEDGLADTADGLGGGATREARLAIMKDSRIGTYGVVVLVTVLLLKIGVLSSLALSLAVPALIAAHAAGRLAGVLASVCLPYAGDTSAAKVKPLAARQTSGALLVAALFGLLPAFLLPLPISIPALLLSALAAATVGLLARRLIGGCTGDVLGAVEQTAEVAFLLAVQAFGQLIHG